MEWYLYLDESGQFDLLNNRGQNEHNLVGGFLVPNSAVSPETCQLWIDKAAQMTKKRLGANGAKYDVTHANKNHTAELNACGGDELQRAITVMYAKEIEKLGGYVVVFNNTPGFSAQTNTNTYLNIVSKGLLLLLWHLQNMMGDQINLHVCLASRKDMDSEDNRTIQVEVYRERLDGIMRILGDEVQQSDPDFQRLLEDLSLLNDIREQGSFKPNPLTVPCDFICNSYYRANTVRYEGWMKDSAFFEVYNGPRSIYLESLSAMKINADAFTHINYYHDYLGLFQKLMASDYPNAMTRRLFALLNVPSSEKWADAFADSLIAFMRAESFVTNSRLGFLNKLQEIRRVFTRYASEKPYATKVQANLYMLEYTILQHIGNEAKMKECHQNIEKLMKDASLSNETVRSLMLMLCNRDIVSATDAFDIETAMENYHYLDQYWEGVFLSANDCPYAEIRQRLGRDAEYGRMMGSYIQAQQHRMRFATEEIRSECRENMKELEVKVGSQFVSSGDVARHYQNMAGLAVELKDWNLAFRYLMLSILQREPSENDPIQLETCRDMLEIIGDNGMEQPYTCYVYEIYVKLMNEMLLAGDTRYTMLRNAVSVRIERNHFEVMTATDRAALCAWKWASTLSRDPDSLPQDKVNAVGLFKFATEIMFRQEPNQSRVYMAIGLAALAEYLDCMEKALIPNQKIHQWEDKFVSEYARYVAQTKQAQARNPFLAAYRPGSCQQNWMAIARCVAY